MPTNQPNAFLDRIRQVTLTSIDVPLAVAVSDAKVLTGRQKALTAVALLIAEIDTEQGAYGFGFTYTLRVGGPAQMALAQEVASLLIGEDPNDIARLWSKLVWESALVGRSGVSTQAIAAIDTALWDLKARRAGLPLAKLLGAYRDGVPCYTTARRMGAALESFNLQWIEEPLDAYDIEGHAALAQALTTPIVTGEMLTSAGEVERYIERGAIDLVMHDAPRIGGITPFLKVAALAESRGLMMEPHFVMEIHLHLTAAYPHETWVEHFEWLEPVSNERLTLRDGKMRVPDRPRLGLSLHERVKLWTVARKVISQPA